MRLLPVAILVATSGSLFAEAPATPTGLATTSVTARSVGLTWNAATLATTYYVYRNGSQIGSSTSTTYSDTGLTAGTSYTYSIVAVNGSDSPVTLSGASDPVTVTTGVLPAVPTGLRASSTSSTVALNWNAVPGASGYVVFRDGVEYDTATTNSFTDDDVELITTYRYSVASVSSAGESGLSTVVAITTKGDGSRRQKVWTQAFQAVDGNRDGIVTFSEYLIGHPSNTIPLVVLYHRFISSDDDSSLDLTVDEYIAHFGGKTVKRPSKVQSFYLADTMDEDDFEGGDGLLTVEEYARTLNRNTKWSQVQKKFDKLDKNGSGYLSQREFGIRNGAVEAE